MTAVANPPGVAAPRMRTAPAGFAGGAAVGLLGGLVGLGGAEFRLPLLLGVFAFAALAAVIVNKAMSLVVMLAAIPARLAAVRTDIGSGRFPCGEPRTGTTQLEARTILSASRKTRPMKTPGWARQLGTADGPDDGDAAVEYKRHSGRQDAAAGARSVWDWDEVAKRCADRLSGGRAGQTRRTTR